MQKFKLRSEIILTIPQEDAAITTAIPTNPVMLLPEDEDLKLVPLSQFLANRPKRGRPAKIAVTIRYSHDVLEAFKSTGEGWQVRMDEALKDWLKHHKPNEARISQTKAPQ